MADYLFSGSSLVLSSYSGFSSIVCGNNTYTGASSAGYYYVNGTFLPSASGIVVGPTDEILHSQNPNTGVGTIQKIYDNRGVIRPGDPWYNSACVHTEYRTWPQYNRSLRELSGHYANGYLLLGITGQHTNLQANDLYPWGFSARMGNQMYSANLRFLSTTPGAYSLDLPQIGPYLSYWSDRDATQPMLEVTIQRPPNANSGALAQFYVSFILTGISYSG